MLYRLFITLFMLAMFNESGVSQDYKQQLESGIEAFYSGDWVPAQEQFDALISSNPEKPEAYFFRSMIPFWTYFFGGLNKTDAKEFLSWSDKAIRITETHLRKAKQDTASVLFLSGLHGYRALVAADQAEYGIAIKSGMTGFNYTKKILAMGDENPDAKIGRGIYYYMTGSVPSQIKWMTSALGFEGNIDWGFEELEKAAASDSRVQIDAKMILSYLYLKENKPNDALRHAESLANIYPKNSIFLFHKAKALDELEFYKDAISAYNQVLSLQDIKLDQLLVISKERVTELNRAFTETLGTK